MSDKQIIERLQTEHRHKAFVKLYAYQSTVQKYILKNNGTKEEAKDIFQEALIILFRNANRSDFKLTSSINTYVFSVAKNLWNEKLRTIQRDAIKIPIPQLDNSTEEIIEQEKKYTLAESALMRISEQCKTILELFYIKKITMSQIAQTMGMSSENAAKTQKYKCLERAKEEYIILSNPVKTR
jgi:RNA polymerase sigma factor (sigma-70 family)